ncbi:unnamed protein product [Rotaria sp. Silwood1]|nr:unnamed protein product [Rotaria sp. Silwood1]CAF4552987.1 unnamed protein product [Rotaria sp. Silwood1]
MNNHISESSSTTKLFRFSSGQCLTLNEYQIEKIPYLTALVSAGINFDSIKVNEEYYLLDSQIDYEHFLYVLDSISFHTVREIFIHLSKNYNILAIIALLDFLAIKSEKDPTLEEVNSSFFWTADFGNKLGTYQFIYRPSDIQDMAVRFAIAIAKEKYDFRNRKSYNMDKYLEISRQKILENIYKRLLSLVLEQILLETHSHEFDDYDELIYKSILDNILNNNTVQRIIQENISLEICELKSKLKRKYVELTKDIQTYERNRAIVTEDNLRTHLLLSYWEMNDSILKIKQNEALAYEQTLKKLHQYESIIDQIRNAILVDLYDLFTDEIQIFINRQEEIWTLINSLLCN